jgi:hypothetical protein
VLHMMSYIYSHCRTEGRWLTGVNLQVRTATMEFLDKNLTKAAVQIQPLRLNTKTDPEAFSSQKRTSSTSNMKFPGSGSGSGFRIRIWIHWPG